MRACCTATTPTATVAAAVPNASDRAVCLCARRAAVPATATTCSWLGELSSLANTHLPNTRSHANGCGNVHEWADRVVCLGVSMSVYVYGSAMYVYVGVSVCVHLCMDVWVSSGDWSGTVYARAVHQGAVGGVRALPGTSRRRRNNSLVRRAS